MQLSHYKELIEYVKKLHGDQTDYTGREYWEHCVRVFEIAAIILASRGCDTTDIFKTDKYDDLIVAALFHDVLEDVDEGYDKLSICLSPKEFNNITRLNLLAKSKDIPYLEYVKNIISSNDWIAILIKFADTLDHVERLPYIEDIEIQARLSAKYAKSLKMLRVALDESLNCPPKDIH